jgi:hypothetical protein
VSPDTCLYELTLVLPLHTKKENGHDIIIFTINKYTQILNIICIENFQVCTDILHVCFPGIINNSNFTEARLHKIFPITIHL